MCKEDVQEVPDRHHPDRMNEPKWTEPVHHKCHLIHHGLYPKSYSKLRQLVEARNVYQDNRLRFQLRMKELKKLGFEPTDIDKKILKGMISKERWLTREYGKIVKELPIWKEWLSKIVGTGEPSCGQLISFIDDIKRFDSVPKLWSFFGLGLYDGKIQAYKLDNHKNFNGKHKQLMYIISKAFVSHRKHNCEYANIYDHYKKIYKEKHPEYNNTHIHMMALRKVSKIFLRDLWKNWNRIEQRGMIEEDCDHLVSRTVTYMSPQSEPLIEVI